MILRSHCYTSSCKNISHSLPVGPLRGRLARFWTEKRNSKLRHQFCNRLRTNLIQSSHLTMNGIVGQVISGMSEEDERRHDHVTLNTWFDKLMKVLTVWLPLVASATLFLDGLTVRGWRRCCCCSPAVDDVQDNTPADPTDQPGDDSGAGPVNAAASTSDVNAELRTEASSGGPLSKGARNRRHSPNQNSDDSGAGPGGINIELHEMHPQPSSGGSSSSKESIHTEDETREKDLARDDTEQQLPVKRPGSKNKAV
ncbi:Hypp50 [Branchiostoma lanceolatum]|uniref:Hypp50 protein n=1 Tax=Branchiostoma lanceolatum TaxID=7740 RepID=A0A8J9YP45_BRALA|nr:Hypp50 [Branchiostoma lanceolatum]